MAAIPVRVEPPGENPVVEVAYDGQEVTQPPLTMGENLAKQARKIDFSQDSEQVNVCVGRRLVLNSCLQAGKEEVDMETGEVESDIKSFQQPGNWPGMYSTWEDSRRVVICKNMIKTSLYSLKFKHS